MVSSDIIGDIHGQLQKLLKLLSKLGYGEVDGIFRHPSRHAIFVGDFIDRGPAIRETLRIVRRMCAEGSALAVLGNHELNALRYASRPDKRLRPELRNTLEQFSSAPEEWKEVQEWFRGLPLLLDLGPLRIVHAVWDTALIQAVNAAQTTLGTEFLNAVLEPNGEVGKAVHSILNGYKLPLPNENVVEESEGSMRNFVRLAWWKNDPPFTYRRLGIPFTLDASEDLIPTVMVDRIVGYGPPRTARFLRALRPSS